MIFEFESQRVTDAGGQIHRATVTSVTPLDPSMGKRKSARKPASAKKVAPLDVGEWNKAESRGRSVTYNESVITHPQSSSAYSASTKSLSIAKCEYPAHMAGPVNSPP
jgi:hypothetical protein